MDRVRFLEHHGRKILLIDYSNVTDDEGILKIVEERKRVVAAQPPRSLVTLTDVTGARFTKKVMDTVRQAAVLDRPFVRRAAMVGVDTLPKGLLEGVENFALRDWKRFDSRQEALDWLIVEEVEAPQGQARAG